MRGGIVAWVLAMAAIGCSSGSHAQTPLRTSAAPASTDTIIVTGRRPAKNQDQLIERFARPFSHDRLARWREPVCITVQGMEPDHAGWVAAYMADIAEAAGAVVADRQDRCDPNLIVMIAGDIPALKRDIARHKNALLNYGRRVPIDKDQLSAFLAEDDKVAHVFYDLGIAVATTGAMVRPGDTASPAINIGGAPVIPNAVASRVVPNADVALQRVLVMLDGKQLVGLSLQQIAAYAAIVGLAEVRTGEPLTEVSTITALFADRTAGKVLPEGVTVWDLDYLRALYGSPSQINGSMQRATMAGRLAHPVEPPPAVH